MPSTQSGLAAVNCTEGSVGGNTGDMLKVKHLWCELPTKATSYNLRNIARFVLVAQDAGGENSGTPST